MALDHLSDEELIEVLRRATAGDLRAFDVLVDRYEARVAANCRHLSGSVEDAQDLKQEVFVKAYFALDSFEGRSGFRTWLWRIKINHCLRFLEKKKGKDYLRLEDQVVAAAPAARVNPAFDAALDADARNRRIAETLDSLPDQHRVPLVLRFVDDLSYAEIAEQLGIGLSATKMRIKRAKAFFREVYTGIDPSAGTPPSDPFPTSNEDR